MAYWIWFPHDFSIDLRGRVEMRRQEHGMTCPSIWRMDAPSRAIAFRRAYTLDAPGRARLFSQGEAYVCIDGASIPDRAQEIALPAGSHVLTVSVMSLTSLPALYLEGDVETDGSFFACENNVDFVPCGWSPAFCAPGKRPMDYCLPTRPLSPAGRTEEGLIDFGREVFGFLHLTSAVGVILNIDNDHLEYYGTMGQLKLAFQKFALLSRTVVFNMDDRNTMDVVSSIDRPVVSFGIHEEARIRAINIKEYKPGFFEFDVLELGEPFAHLQLGVPGYHNIYNALAMCACVRPLHLKPEDAVRAAAEFHGTGRRFEIKGECNGAVIVDDYAHHPTELAATLATAKEMGYERVIAVHQPFTYSRTKMLMDDFAKVLSVADQVVLLPIMGSREKDDGSVKSEDLAAKIPGSIVVDGLESAAEWVKKNAHKGDLIVCMSCGDLYKAADMMVGK